jgi:D-alanine-D-alanine ligase-like ATP-grasp enzyme
MKITVTMVITYILFCIRIGTKPCKYFQLNSPQFDAKQGIFSKLSIDQNIPLKWRLDQQYDDEKFEPRKWPVFIKPEWGQNAAGVQRADNAEQLEQIRSGIRDSRIKYLVQQGAPETREFEVFSLRHHEDKSKYAILTVTEAVNDLESDPVNSIYNPHTRYVEITENFSQEQLDLLWQLVNQLGQYNISRASMRADSVEDLLAGRFHVIEVNLFVPMPINMLDARYRPKEILSMILSYMMSLARLTRTRDKGLKEKPVFTKIMLYNRESRFLNFVRDRI